LKFWKKQHIDPEKLQQERVRKAELAEILDHGDRGRLLSILKAAGIPITEERPTSLGRGGVRSADSWDDPPNTPESKNHFSGFIFVCR